MAVGGCCKRLEHALRQPFRAASAAAMVAVVVEEVSRGATLGTLDLFLRHCGVQQRMQCLRHQCRIAPAHRPMRFLPTARRTQVLSTAEGRCLMVSWRQDGMCMVCEGRRCGQRVRRGQRLQTWRV